MAQRTWFITGASSGLGLEMALAALRAGHRVIGTSRNITRAATEHGEFERLGGHWLQLDVAASSCEQTMKDLVTQEENRAQGPLHWVVVNNAGATIIGAVEDMSDGQISDYLQANVFGFIRVWKALLPSLRRHRDGTLITISSIFGFVSKPEQMLYSAVKATTESLTESYAALLGPFGIRTLIVEPGGFRTKFPGNHTVSDGGVSEDYKQQIKHWMEVIDTASKDPNVVDGDPVRFGESLLDAVEGKGLFADLWAGQNSQKALRIQLGSDSYAMYGGRLTDLNEGYANMLDIAKSTDAIS